LQQDPSPHPRPAKPAPEPASETRQSCAISLETAWAPMVGRNHVGPPPMGRTLPGDPLGKVAGRRTRRLFPPARPNPRGLPNAIPTGRFAENWPPEHPGPPCLRTLEGSGRNVSSRRSELEGAGAEIRLLVPEIGPTDLGPPSYFRPARLPATEVPDPHPAPRPSGGGGLTSCPGAESLKPSPFRQKDGNRVPRPDRDHRRRVGRSPESHRPTSDGPDGFPALRPWNLHRPLRKRRGPRTKPVFKPTAPPGDPLREIRSATLVPASPRLRLLPPTPLRALRPRGRQGGRGDTHGTSRAPKRAAGVRGRPFFVPTVPAVPGPGRPEWQEGPSADIGYGPFRTGARRSHRTNSNRRQAATRDRRGPFPSGRVPPTSLGWRRWARTGTAIGQ